MFRALLELVVTIILAMAARAILASLMKGFQNASRTSSQAPPPPPPQQPKERVSVAGDLHKDPVCGMYVTESTRYQRSSGREKFYYCSEQCKDKHAVAAR
jgi:YHS domain-containing protein